MAYIKIERSNKMHKIFLLVCSLIFYKIPDSKLPLYENCLKPTVMIKSLSEKNTGTGFIVRSQKAIENYYINTVISCAHVCEEKIKIAVPEYKDSSVIGYKEYKAIVISANTNFDLSIIVFFSENQLNTIDIDFNSENYIDDDVFSIGCGLGESPRLSKGFISGLSTDMISIRTSISCVPGDSGGPMFKKNKAIGVCVGIKSYNGQIVTDISVFKSIDKIKEILDKNKYFLINKEDKSIPKIFYYSLLESLSK